MQFQTFGSENFSIGIRDEGDLKLVLVLFAASPGMIG